MSGAMLAVLEIPRDRQLSNFKPMECTTNANLNVDSHTCAKTCRQTHTHKHTHAHRHTRTQRYPQQAHAHKHARSNLAYLRWNAHSDVIAYKRSCQSSQGWRRIATTTMSSLQQHCKAQRTETSRLEDIHIAEILHGQLPT